MSFEDIKLQDRAAGFLKRCLAEERLSHSLLFFGPDGVGKGLAALTLAKALNCESKGPRDSCDVCSSCRRTASRNHPDITWIMPEGAGNVIKIERIRVMKEKISLKPFEGRAKVFIIDGAHLLNEESANSMLKILEEPPKDSIIILITEDLSKILPTLRSRCQWVLFSPAKTADLKKFLISEYGFMETEAHLFSHLAGGSIGRAIIMKDKNMLEEKNAIIDRFSKESVIFEEDPLFFNKKKAELASLMDILISWYRDIFILTNGGSESLLTNVDRLADLRSKAGSLSPDKAREALEEALRMQRYIKENANPKLVLANLVCTVN